ncbi:hypothetical protein SPRG_02858 [Saprolegnia parasitica CBS 223.65]|uniref:Uncharacterized protein n=1 Tax=Saprolegnia parasitica (strain CBS 223.65) TaxID=695850 RepID=A0A067D0T9_SAPPC|nr:hypothetical protein SPRG_02858 [Saprolegnia parasitica CBS 223.65]KDO32381.1 hypothetical protein SPRG_02858 [Saprolegnia parasitica CBS 223.65]|eukprot:XP_012196835.1 hypothetical protein SPRG_02858 [Saprolegnia parasitica CBS 223.65]
MFAAGDVRAPMTSLIALTPTSIDVPVRRGKQPKAATRSHSEPSSAEKASPKLDTLTIPYDDWFIMPLYVCPTHATKDGLSESYRHKGSWTKPEPIRIEQKQMRAAPSSSTMWAVPFTYIITVNNVSHQFKCAWNEYRAYQKALLADEKLGPLYTDAVHSRYVEESFKGSMRRAIASLERMSEEVMGCLHAISQIPEIATQRAYQDLVGCQTNTLLHEELVTVLAKDHEAAASPKKTKTASFDDDDASVATDTFDELQECLCDVYVEAIALFGAHVHGRPRQIATSDDEEHDAKVEEVVCMDMLRIHCMLALYTDCLFTLDKEQLTSSTNYALCTVLGFGCRPLFTVKRSTKTKWILSDASQRGLMTMTLKRYGANQPMIVVARVVSSGAEEVVGMFRKSWRRGYQFLLMSELVTQGKLTTSFAFSNMVIHGQHRYLVGSVVSGSDQRDLLVTATLSVSDAAFHTQRLHVTDSSDVLLQIALACSYDFLASARPFYRMDYHY